MRRGRSRSWCGWTRLRFCSSPLTRPVDYARTAALELVAEVLEEALPEGAPEDAVFRLAVAVLRRDAGGPGGDAGDVLCLWMSRLMGWMPELGRCAVCGLDLRGGTVWYSATSDGVTCEDDRRRGECGFVGGFGGGGAEDISRDSEGAGGGGLAAGAGGGAAAVCRGDAGAASGAEIGECSGVGESVS